MWNELLTYETSIGKFYRTVFGFELEPADPPGDDYATLFVEGTPWRPCTASATRCPGTGGRTG